MIFDEIVSYATLRQFSVVYFLLIFPICTVYLFTHIFEKYSKWRYRLFGLVFFLLTLAIIYWRHPQDPLLVPFVAWAYFVCGIRNVRWFYKLAIAYLSVLFLLGLKTHMY